MPFRAPYLGFAIIGLTILVWLTIGEMELQSKWRNVEPISTVIGSAGCLIVPVFMLFDPWKKDD